MNKKNQINFIQNENQQQPLDSDRAYDFQAEQRWCDTVKKEMENLKNVAFQIKDLIKNGKIEDENFRDVYEKLQEKDFNTDLTIQQSSFTNQQIVSSPPQKQQNTKSQIGGKSIFKNDSNRNSNTKGSFSQNGSNNMFKQDQEDNKEDFKEIKNMLDKMTNEVQKSLIETQQLKQELKQNKGDRENMFNIDKNDWDLNYIEYQKRQDKNREEISTSQRKIHDMQNKRLAQKVQDLHQELQQKMQQIDQKDEEYNTLVEKIQVYFGVLKLNHNYFTKQQNRDEIQNINQYTSGNFIFELKRLFITNDLLKDKNPDIQIFYHQISEVKYAKENRNITIKWNPNDQGILEQITIRFDNDQDMNKFDMLLFILCLNNTAFSTNSFTGYFEQQKQINLHDVLRRPQDSHDNSRVEKSFKAMQSGLRQNNNERINTDLIIKAQKLQMNASEIQTSNMNRSAASPMNNSILDFDQTHKKNRSFTPMNFTLNNTENRQQESMIFRRNEVNGEELNYNKMNSEKYWDEKIQKSVKKQDIRIEVRDKFMQIFYIKFIKRNANPDQKQPDYDISHLDVKKSLLKDNVIEIVQKKTDEKLQEIELHKQEFDNFYRQLKFFFYQNLQKQKEITKAILDLKNGMIFLKYSKNSFKPHEKLFQYEEGQGQRPTLISRLPSDANGKDKKVTYFSEILSFALGWESGPGFKKFQKNDKRIIKELCLVIQLKNSKTIEVLAKTQQQRDQFYNYLSIIYEQVNLGK